MKILGIIPARGGSEGIPKKNIKLLAGKPLIAYTISQAKQASFLDKVIVSTDSEEIAAKAIELGAEVPFIRPSAISNSLSPSIDYVRHALDFFRVKETFYDAVCILQPTSPFRPKGVIDKAVKEFMEYDADTLVSVREVPSHYNPYWLFEKSENGDLMPMMQEKVIINRRQDLPKAFQRDGAIYIVKSSVIFMEKTLYGKKFKGLEIESPALINIDNESDWKMAEKYIH